MKKGGAAPPPPAPFLPSHLVTFCIIACEIPIWVKVPESVKKCNSHLTNNTNNVTNYYTVKQNLPLLFAEIG